MYMKALISTVRILFIAHVLFTLLLTTTSPAQSTDGTEHIQYDLAISFTLDTNKLNGTARISLPPKEILHLDLRSLNISRILLQQDKRSPRIIEHIGVKLLSLPVSEEKQEIYISFDTTVTIDADNLITPEGITLLHSWYPLPSRDVIFSVSAELPTGFSAVCQSDFLNRKKERIHKFSFSKPEQHIHFVAAPFIVQHQNVRPGLRVFSYFSERNRNLAKEYLDSAADYLKLYENMIGPYPYNHFAIVENPRPTGYGMATFTLLGASVIRLPFIKDTSLGHEILHSWFGNSIRTRTNSGNWVEGLTSYLADHYYREQRQEGAINRKENIGKYLSYNPDAAIIPLKDFRSASHHQPMARSVRSVGYIRGAMVFHELRILIGEEKFFAGIKALYSTFAFKRAGWDDIRKVFEDITGEDLREFFEQRLDRTTLPNIRVKNLIYDSSTPAPALRFTLMQLTTEPFLFRISFKVETTTGHEIFHRTITANQTEISLPLRSPALQLRVDPEYDILRVPGTKEFQPSWSIYMGPAEVSIVAENDERDIFGSFFDLYAQENWSETGPSKTLQQLTRNNLILIGKNNGVAKQLFGPVTHRETGFTLDCRPHPLDSTKSILLLSAENKEQVELAVRKLRHYGKYALLHFENGRLKTKKNHHSEMGLIYRVNTPPLFQPAKSVQTLSEVVTETINSRVYYIGERHTSTADHLLQFQIIEELHRRGADLAIGMEMFPVSSQPALDSYLDPDQNMSEQNFLKQSKYFDVWKYDYRLYRPIINFAKENGIPLIALNTEGKITRSVFRNGSTEKLTEEEKSLLPEERDLSLPGYFDRLQAIHNLHIPEGHDSRALAGFIQAQAIWDETMAENIANYLLNEPMKKMVVIAGSQHTRKDSGVPPRVARRANVQQTTFLNQGEAETALSETADFLVTLVSEPLPPAGKIGLVLQEKEDGKQPYVEIQKSVEASNAAKAGFLLGDRIKAINNIPVQTMADIRIAMVDASPGDKVNIRVERVSGENDTEQINIPVELYSPANIN